MTTSCTSSIGTIGYSAGQFSRVCFSFNVRDGLRTFTPRKGYLRVEGSGVLVNTLWTERYPGHFNEVFIDTSLLNKHGE